MSFSLEKLAATPDSLLKSFDRLRIRLRFVLGIPYEEMSCTWMDYFTFNDSLFFEVFKRITESVSSASDVIEGLLDSLGISFSFESCKEVPADDNPFDSFFGYDVEEEGCEFTDFCGCVLSVDPSSGIDLKSVLGIYGESEDGLFEDGSDWIITYKILETAGNLATSVRAVFMSAPIEGDYYPSKEYDKQDCLFYLTYIINWTELARLAKEKVERQVA